MDNDFPYQYQILIDSCNYWMTEAKFVTKESAFIYSEARESKYKSRIVHTFYVQSQEDIIMIKEATK